MAGFTALNLKFHMVGDPPTWPHLRNAVPVLGFEMVAIEKGMESGKPAVGILVRLVNGESAVVQTSGALICAVARAIEARFPNVMDPEDAPTPSAPSTDTKN